MEMEVVGSPKGKEQASPNPADCMDYICLPDETGHTTVNDDWSLLDSNDGDVQWTLTACWIAVGAVLGAFLRMLLAQLFGQACANPGTVGWLSAGAPLCVTADGLTEQQGGIVFADLPSNLLGSFFMGLVQNHVTLGLAVPMRLAWLPPHHPLQRATPLLTAFTTGFCGSLTTFSSWNSEMVVMMLGDARSGRSTQLWSALFGYIIGMETAWGSFVCGCSVARRLHRWINPLLADEAKASQRRAAEGVHVNIDLPDLERRFLPDLPMHNSTHNTATEMLGVSERTSDLAGWRSSTVEARRVGNPVLATLVRIETAVLVLDERIDTVSESIAHENGWALDRLLEYAAAKRNDLGALPKVSSSVSMGNHVIWTDRDRWWSKLHVAAPVLGTVLVLMILALMFVNGQSEVSVTYRTMVFALLFAPSGALLRWKWSSMNSSFQQSLPPEWKWLPVGTLSANVFGSAVSILMVGLEIRLGKKVNPYVFNFWRLGAIRAIKVGFAGCLTTVSTFVSEVQSFMLKKSDHAYPYIFVTLLTSCILASAVYALVVFT